MSLSAKREYLAKIHGRYQRAGRPHKSRILEEFCLNCGYHRKAALRLLNRPLHRPSPKRPGPKPRYQPALLLPPLKAIWLLSDQLCSKLLKAALPHWLQAYEQLTGVLPAPVRTQLLTISPAQIDRLLKPARVRYPRKGLLYHQTRHAPASPSPHPWRSARHLPARSRRGRHRCSLWRHDRRGLRPFPHLYRTLQRFGPRSVPSGTRAPTPS